MQIRNLFDRDIFRPINGVVKADQLDDSSVWQELDEFVVTKELDQHFRRFLLRTIAMPSSTKMTPTSPAGLESGSLAFSAPANPISSKYCLTFSAT